MVTPIVLLWFNLFGHFTWIDWTCFLHGYHQCDGIEKSCPDGFIRAGNSSCLAI